MCQSMSRASAARSSAAALVHRASTMATRLPVSIGMAIRGAENGDFTAFDPRMPRRSMWFSRAAREPPRRPRRCAAARPAASALDDGRARARARPRRGPARTRPRSSPAPAAKPSSSPGREQEVRVRRPAVRLVAAPRRSRRAARPPSASAASQRRRTAAGAGSWRRRRASKRSRPSGQVPASRSAASGAHAGRPRPAPRAPRRRDRRPSPAMPGPAKKRACRPRPQARSSTGAPGATSAAKRRIQGEGGRLAAGDVGSTGMRSGGGRSDGGRSRQA